MGTVWFLLLESVEPDETFKLIWRNVNVCFFSKGYIAFPTRCCNGILLFGLDFPGCSDSKESACSAGDPGSIPGSGRDPGERNSNPLPLQSSCLENPTERGTWWGIVHGVEESPSQLTLSLSLLLVSLTSCALQRPPPHGGFYILWVHNDCFL